MTWECRRPSSRMRAYMVRSSFSWAGWGSDQGPVSGSVAAAGGGVGFFLSAATERDGARRVNAARTTKARRERANIGVTFLRSGAAGKFLGKGRIQDGGGRGPAER